MDGECSCPHCVQQSCGGAGLRSGLQPARLWAQLWPGRDRRQLLVRGHCLIPCLLPSCAASFLLLAVLVPRSARCALGSE